MSLYLFLCFSTAFYDVTLVILPSVRRKGSTRTDDEPSMPSTLSPASRGHLAIELPNDLSNEGFQEESGAEETMSQEDDDDENAVYVESKSDGKATSKKRKASRKLKSPRLVLSSHILTATKLREL